ncbi:MAG: hypothetical protein FJ387_03200 [Verrucomicrobia bacterium]|nr:hypothetical protein [Verrucomicrobiota bacterium]
MFSIKSTCQLPALGLAFLLPLNAGPVQAPLHPLAGTTTEPAASAETPLLIGGVGGVYFLAEPGELVVEVEKRDLNRRGSRAELRALLVGPDRQVLQEATLPDDGQPRGSGLGPVQRCRLSTKVPAQGVYALNVTVSQDRYGEEMVWGFRANCPKYLIETARGHKDERHQEPIVLASPGRPATVCFWPRREALELEVTGLPVDAGDLKVFDAQGTLLATIPVGTNGAATHHFSARIPRTAAPWQLHLPSAQATVNLDGVTRWDSGDLYPDMACWTPDPQSWFPLLDNRWLLTPYRRTVHGVAGERTEVAFQVHNNSARERTVQLIVESPEGAWPAGQKAAEGKSVALSAERVVLGPKQTGTVTVSCIVPPQGERRSARLRVTPLDETGFSTYSTLTVKAGEAPANRPLAMPIVLRPYQHENEQFGHRADYPVENQVYFDARNRPFLWAGGGIAAWREGQWDTPPLRVAVSSRTPSFAGDSFGLTSTKIAFDRDHDLYTLATAGRTTVLLHSADGAQTFAAYAIPGRDNQPRAFDVEQYSGHNLPEGPPPILRYTQTARDEKLIWRRLNDLELFVPKKVGGRLLVGEPILLSTKCIGLSAHSGIPAAVVSRGSRVHVAWGEATNPQQKVPGVPAFVATYDRDTGQLGQPALVAYGPPANDVHNSPSITIDSKGYLHILAGTHGRPFPYARSLQPNDAQAGWTDASPAGEGLGQTYIGLVCGPDDTLHSVFRMWRSGVEPFPASSHATLAYQRKRPGQPWEAPRVLIVAPFSEYSIFYHRLTIDRHGRLFLSYDYWSTFWFYRNDHFGRRRALLMSPDGGETWKLADTMDLTGVGSSVSSCSQDVLYPPLQTPEVAGSRRTEAHFIGR